MSDTSFLRPSILPKLALCGHYRSAGGNAATERGTVIDAAFRKFLGAPDAPYLRPLNPDESVAADWAACTARILTGGNSIDATESGCRVDGLPEGMAGTADGVCRFERTSFDLKSGQKRDYMAQQACYALGFMMQEDCDEWTVRLLYCDLQTVETLRFTWETAEDCIHDALALWRAKEVPQVNDYCGWCSQRFECPAYRDAFGQWLAPLNLTQPPGTLAGVASAALVGFVAMARDLEDWVTEARRLLKERYDSGEREPGVKVIAKRGARKVDAVDLIEHVEPKTLALAFGQLSEDKAKGLWPEMPESLVKELPGRVELHVSRPKTKSTKE